MSSASFPTWTCGRRWSGLPGSSGMGSPLPAARRSAAGRTSRMPDPIEMTVATIRYRNYRGEITTRRIVPYDLSFRATEHHPLPQWIIDAWDLDKPGGKVSRSFAVADILEWERG